MKILYKKYNIYETCLQNLYTFRKMLINMLIWEKYLFKYTSKFTLAELKKKPETSFILFAKK